MTDQKDMAIAGEGDLNKAPEGEEKKPEEKADEKKDEIAPLLEGDDEEEITIKRGLFKKVHTDKENYKTVALSKKGKDGEAKNLSEKKEEPKGDESKFVTKAELEKEREDKAIEKATVAPEGASEEDAALAKEINDNWDAIKAFYVGRGGKKTVEAIHDDILDAHASWKRRQGTSEKPSGDTTVAANLAATRGKGGTSPKANNTGESRKRIIPRDQSAKDWYPDGDK